MIPIRDTIPHRRFPFSTWFIIILNGLVFIFELSLSEEDLRQFTYVFGVVPQRYFHLESFLSQGFLADYLPFLSSMFLHGGWFHIIGNMWFLHLFGDNVEDCMGHIRFLIFYLLSGITATLIFVYFEPHSRFPVIGASGAIAGVMGAYFIMFPRSRILTLLPVLFIPYFIEIPAVIFLGLWFILQLFSGTFALVIPEAGGGIAWWAHIGGFIVGILLLPIFRKKAYRRRYRDERYHFIIR